MTRRGFSVTTRIVRDPITASPPLLSRRGSCVARSFLGAGFRSRLRLAGWPARHHDLSWSNHPPIHGVSGTENPRHRTRGKLLTWLVDQRLFLPGIEWLSDRLDALDPFAVQHRSKLPLDQDDALGPVRIGQRGRKRLHRALEVVKRWQNFENRIGSGASREISAFLLNPTFVVDEVGLRSLGEIKVGLALRPRFFQLSF